MGGKRAGAGAGRAKGEGDDGRGAVHSVRCIYLNRRFGETQNKKKVTTTARSDSSCSCYPASFVGLVVRRRRSSFRSCLACPFPPFFADALATLASRAYRNRFSDFLPAATTKRPARPLKRNRVSSPALAILSRALRRVFDCSLSTIEKPACPPLLAFVRQPATPRTPPSKRTTSSSHPPACDKTNGTKKKLYTSPPSPPLK